jgi:thiol-disulfide isomerase/thioredoxin
MANYAKYESLGKHQKNNINSTCIEIQSIKDKKKSIEENEIVCVNISSPKCEPCNYIANQYSNLAEMYKPYGCLLIKEDYDLGFSNQITGIPTFMFYIKGKHVKSITGADIHEVDETIKQILESKRSQTQPLLTNNDSRFYNTNSDISQHKSKNINSEKKNYYSEHNQQYQIDNTNYQKGNNQQNNYTNHVPNVLSKYAVREHKKM